MRGIKKWDIPRPGKGPIAATYGLSYYSAPFAVKKGQAYRVLFDFKGPRKGAGAKLWVRGYGILGGKKKE